MKKSLKTTVVGVLLAFVAAMLVSVYLARLFDNSTPAVSAITKEGVITEIQKLSRLNSVAFSVDTVITAEKQGNWYRLWQDGQRGLFVAHGRVLAGIDLAKLNAEMVSVSYGEQTDPDIAPVAYVDITLPPAQIFEVYLDNIQVYDWQTGMFGLVDNDPEVLNQAQTQGKLEVLSKACDGQIMQMALDNAKEQVAALFQLTGAEVRVHGDQIGACRIS